MKPLPLPVRLAAGIVATVVEQAKDLPKTLTELPVTAVSQALQASMRVQQRVTELAIKGDRALGMLQTVEEKPAWATFDDEDEPLTHTNGASKITVLRPDPAVEPEPEAGPPTSLPAYPELTIPQLRGKLRHLDLAALHELLQWETSHDNRPPFVTMLANRITTVTQT